MKKKVFLLAGLLMAGVTFAQNGETPELTNKRGEVIGPKVGQWAFGTDGEAIFNYVGDFFDDGASTSPNFQLADFNTLIVKYVKSENLHYRGRFNIDIDNDTWDTPLASFGTMPSADDSAAVGTNKVSETEVFLAFGLQWRKGHGRLRGYYGAELGFGYESQKETNEWEFDYANIGGLTGMPRTRLLEDDVASIFAIGVRGFFGAEFFFCPSVSVSGEFGWGIGWETEGEGETKMDDWDGAANTESTLTTGSGSEVDFLTDNGFTQALKFLFYF